MTKKFSNERGEGDKSFVARATRCARVEIFPRESNRDFRGKREETDEFFEGDRRARIARADEKASLIEAADFLSRGRLVAFPTETVFGLGCDVFRIRMRLNDCIVDEGSSA